MPAHAEAHRPTALLWDVGNVIVRWDPRVLYRKLIPDAAALDHFLAEVATMAWHVEHDRGRPFAEGIAELSARHPEHAALIGVWRERFLEMSEGGLISETLAAMDALAARGVPQFALTNMSAEVKDDYFALHPAFAHIRDVIVSGAEGCVKPDRRIYEIVLERTGLAARDLLFVDDSPANIAAAAALGFDTHHFTDPAALRPALEARGLL